MTGHSQTLPFVRYWPEGWGWERYSYPDVDFTTLSEDERAKMLNDLRQVLGDNGMRSLSVFRRQITREWRDKRLNEHGVPPPEYEPPNFLKHQQKTRSWMGRLRRICMGGILK